MGISDIAQIVSAVIGLASSIGGALMLSTSEEDRRIARRAFYIAGFSFWVLGVLMTINSSDQSLILRMVIAGVIGAIAAAATVWAASLTMPASSRPDPQAKEVPLTEKFVQNVTSYNQQGGITAGTVNIGPQKLTFSPELGRELLQNMPNSRKVKIQSIGGNADQAVASEIQAFLQSNGYETSRAAIGMTVPPPDHKISLATDQEGYVLVVAPSAN